MSLWLCHSLSHVSCVALVSHSPYTFTHAGTAPAWLLLRRSAPRASTVCWTLTCRAQHRWGVRKEALGSDVVCCCCVVWWHRSRHFMNDPPCAEVLTSAHVSLAWRWFLCMLSMPPPTNNNKQQTNKQPTNPNRCARVRWVRSACSSSSPRRHRQSWRGACATGAQRRRTRCCSGWQTQSQRLQRHRCVAVVVVD